MLLRTAHRTRDTGAPVTHLEFAGDDYDTLLAEARAAIPDGHVMLWIDVERP